MKRKSDKVEDDIRPEYDLSQLKVVARGPARIKPGEVSVVLEPDVAEVFPDAAAVNQALRFLARVTREELKAAQRGR